MSFSGAFWTDERVEELKRLHAQGLTFQQIGDKIGTSRLAVGGKIHRLGLNRGSRAKPSTRPVSAAQRAFVTGGLWSRPPHEQPQPMPHRDRETPADVSGLVAFADLENHHCRWPVGDPKHEGFGFCGGPRVIGLPYCEAHARRAYQPRGGLPEQNEGPAPAPQATPETVGV